MVSGVELLEASGLVHQVPGSSTTKVMSIAPPQLAFPRSSQHRFLAFLANRWISPGTLREDHLGPAPLDCLPDCDFALAGMAALDRARRLRWLPHTYE